VLTVSTSEFGRRVYSNGSYGTDHGVGAPIMLFGKGVEPGILGNNPNLDLDDVEMQYDYRQVYATILKEWMCVDPAKVDEEFGLFWGDYQGRGINLPIINTSLLSTQRFISNRFYMNNCYPNPASFSTTFSFFLNNEVNVELNIMNMKGQMVKQVINQKFPIGEHRVIADVRGIPEGTYMY
ncbi:MAG: DUF1501 domain-containing protein, partial [Cytophagaceae bacterium]